MNRLTRNIRSCGAFVFPDGGKASCDGKRIGGFTNFGRKAFIFRREPARASIAGVIRNRKDTQCPAVAN